MPVNRQQQVAEVLKENKDEWFHARDIAKKLKIERTTVANAVRRLHEKKKVSKRVTFGIVGEDFSGFGPHTAKIVVWKWAS
jgi:response regulator of citrate/malate metabolism